MQFPENTQVIRDENLIRSDAGYLMEARAWYQRKFRIWDIHQDTQVAVYELLAHLHFGSMNRNEAVYILEGLGVGSYRARKVCDAVVQGKFATPEQVGMYAAQTLKFYYRRLNEDAL